MPTTHQFAALIAQGLAVEDAYWELAAADVVDAAAVLRPVHDTCGGTDGFVSIEVAPELARDTAATIAAAGQLHERIARPNVFVKIPATAEGIPAIADMIGKGVSINITLIFSLARYEQVIEAYLQGLEALAARGGDLAAVRSVASFFVSRVDTEVDRRLERIGDAEVPALRGRAAIAQARLAYRIFRDRFTGARWATLAARGARVQRPLWASTSTKDPAYPDTRYVDSLIGPDTVNTLPEATITAFEDHGTLTRSIDTEPAAAAAVLRRARRGGHRHGRRRPHPRRPGRRRLPPVLRRRCSPNSAPRPTSWRNDDLAGPTRPERAGPRMHETDRIVVTP